jgi:hypothetical protein
VSKNNFRRKPRSALVYSRDNGHLSDEQFERLKSELEDNFQSARNAGRPMLLEGGLDWKALSLSPKDMDFIEAKSAAARGTALAFGVPPLVLGIPGDNHYSNFQEANRAFWRQTIIPLLNRTQKSFMHWLAPAYAQPFVIDYDIDRIEALADERAVEWKRIGDAAFLSDDEKREAVGYGKNARPRRAGMAGPAVQIKPDHRYWQDQPRVPAGNSDGGEWAPGGGRGKPEDGGGNQEPIPTLKPLDDTRILSDAPTEEALKPGAQYASNAAAAAENPGKYTANLEAEEEPGGISHAKARHIDPTDQQLLDNVRAVRKTITETPNLRITEYGEALGRFDSVKDANELVSSVLNANKDSVDRVSSGERRGAVLQKEFGYQTGTEAFRSSADSDPFLRRTYAVRVVIRYVPGSDKGYGIVTAYPINKLR